MPLISGILVSTASSTMTSSDQCLSPMPEELGHLDMEHTTDSEFDDTEIGYKQCLFCNELCEDQDSNVQHMSKAHGFRIEIANLVVDIEAMLAYCDLMITEHHTCICCGTVRNNREAIQQHMTAKGHCKYAPTDEDFCDFYDHTSANEELELRQRRLAQRASRTTLHSSDLARTNARLTSTISARQEIRNAAPPTDSLSPSPESQTGIIEGAEAAFRNLSVRATKQASSLNSQLSNLRASDRAALAHLPSAQQRAVLSTQQKQLASARRVEQVKWSRLENAGNTVNCLSKTRLIPIPPHKGHVQSLKH
jgi:pre-60S factor REI1